MVEYSKVVVNICVSHLFFSLSANFLWKLSNDDPLIPNTMSLGLTFFARKSTMLSTSGMRWASMLLFLISSMIFGIEMSSSGGRSSFFHGADSSTQSACESALG